MRFLNYIFLTLILVCISYHADAAPVRVGEHKTFTRIAIDLPKKEDVKADTEGKEVYIRFQTPQAIDVKSLKGDTIKDARLGDDGKVLILTLTNAATLKTFYSDNAFVVDLQKTNTAAAKSEAKTEKKSEVKETAKPAETIEKPKEETAEAAAKELQLTPQDDIFSARETSSSKTSPDLISASTVPVYLTENQTQTGLRFAWPKPTGAAVFRRGDYIWVVFDQPGRFLLNRSQQSATRVLGKPEQINVDKGSAMRVAALPGINPSITRDGLSWVIDIKPQDVVPKVPVIINVEPRAALGPRVFATANDAIDIISVVDPDLGDKMLVVPTQEISRGVAVEKQFPQFSFPKTLQGLCVIPIADSTVVQLEQNGVEIKNRQGLLISDPDKITNTIFTEKKRLFDFAKSSSMYLGDYTQTRWKLESRLVTAAKGAELSAVRLDLAWFYFVNQLFYEASGMLKLIKDEDQLSAKTEDFIALDGAVNLFLNNQKEAWTALANSDLDNRADIELWRAAAAAANGTWDIATQKFKIAEQIPPDYLPFVQVKLQLLAAETALANKDDDGARRLLEDITSVGDLKLIAQAYPVLGDVFMRLGQEDQAVKVYSEAVASGNPGSVVRGRLALALIDLKNEKIDKAKAASILEGMRFEWRGDDFEYDLLKNLGRLYIELDKPRDGLMLLRQAVKYFPDKPENEQLKQLMTSTFKDLFFGGKSNDMTPISALAIFDEFHELTPEGPDGDEMIRKLADRLVSVDLLTRASDLLQKQLDSRLEGLDKARVGARLALIYLFDRNPKAALKALEDSNMPGMPNDLGWERNRLHARALIDISKPAEALTNIEGDTGVAADMLRADIYWQLQDWPKAAATFMRLLEYKKGLKQVDEQAAHYILNAAVAYSLAEDDDSLQDLRVHYGNFMESTALKDAFRVVSRAKSSPTGIKGLTDRVKEVDDFQSFMKLYQDKLKTSGLSGLY